MARSEKIERFARQIGFYAFNRWARKQGYTVDFTLCIIRSVFKGVHYA